ncbi:MAG TPA: ATP-binding SpoIIE family protein phosphatase [Methylomirabilota bacterium]|nr:ATP-binding SpoIIE family protein phosphatase [Methylomirabilota bacterium]
MTPFCSQKVVINDSSQVGEARRMAVSLGRSLGLSDVETGKLGIIATEAANNICKHAEKGMLIFRQLQEAGIAGVELLAMDKGPGMADVNKCLRDGYSTAGTPGHGLGAITRLSTEWDIWSAPSFGTILMTRVWAKPVPRQMQERLDVGAICLPVDGEVASGDAWAYVSSPVEHRFFLADGLGHGPGASESSEEAVRVFNDHAWESPTMLMNREHNALKKTRGAAIALAQVQFGTRLVRFTGVGNIAGGLCQNVKLCSFVSHNGTAGAEMRKVQEFEYAWPHGASCILHSDGLGTRWNLNSLPGLLNHRPSVIAAGLFREFHRERDDVTVLVLRER